MLFPQNNSFSYSTITKDKYGTKTTGTAVSCLGYIEPEIAFSSDGSMLCKGKIYTTDATSFVVDSPVTIDGDIYYINNIETHNVINYKYKVLSYV